MAEPAPLITDQREFEKLLGEFRSTGCFALDTEFIRERSYRPRLCLLQIGIEGESIAVDPFAVKDMRPLVDALMDASVEKIVHAAYQDMEIFFADTKKVPRNLFDTQIAAALTGHGDSVGYSSLLRETLGVRLRKQETFTDWATRPLSPQQIEYALDDVRYLPALRAKLSEMLESLGRIDWLTEEGKIYENTLYYTKDPSTLYLRIRGATRCNREELAVLQELAKWREEEALSRDRPRGRIISDSLLVELARRSPRNRREIKGMRGVHPELIRRSGDTIVKAVNKALKRPPKTYPEEVERVTISDHLAPTVDLLESLLKIRASDKRISPGLLATRSDLYALLLSKKDGRKRDLRVLNGWRRELVGDDLLRLLDGSLKLTINPKNGKVVVERRKPEEGRA